MVELSEEEYNSLAIFLVRWNHTLVYYYHRVWVKPMEHSKDYDIFHGELFFDDYFILNYSEIFYIGLFYCSEKNCGLFVPFRKVVMAWKV